MIEREYTRITCKLLKGAISERKPWFNSGRSIMSWYAADQSKSPSGVRYRRFWRVVKVSRSTAAELGYVAFTVQELVNK